MPICNTTAASQSGADQVARSRNQKVKWTNQGETETASICQGKSIPGMIRGLVSRPRWRSLHSFLTLGRRESCSWLAPSSVARARTPLEDKESAEVDRTGRLQMQQREVRRLVVVLWQVIMIAAGPDRETNVPYHHSVLRR